MSIFFVPSTALATGGGDTMTSEALSFFMMTSHSGRDTVKRDMKSYKFKYIPKNDS